MRADRLISLLMLLQNRGTMTAKSLAGELEVSERTVYRDIEALSTAGVPVYTECGPGGGCSLLESYRTNLTGLTADEVQALFMLSIPAPLTQLGFSQELKAALLKLTAALPASHRQEEERIRQRVHLDSSWWNQSEETAPHLQVVQQAAWQDRKLRICYQLEFGAQVERVVAPYGIVAKAAVWFLVGARPGQVRVYRVSRIREAEILDEPFERPADFDLADFWKSWCAGYEEESRPSYPVVARVAAGFLGCLPHFFGESIRAVIESAGPADADGRVSLTLPFQSLEAARDRLLGFGRAVEVLEPPALRRSMQDFAKQIASVYAA
jgi:predicted DNA-binding transcriptional regulator YafY